jgi:hypothetical protein
MLDAIPSIVGSSDICQRSCGLEMQHWPLRTQTAADIDLPSDVSLPLAMGHCLATTFFCDSGAQDSELFVRCRPSPGVAVNQPND